MYHNISAGRLRQYIEIQEEDTEPNEYGISGGFDTVIKARANVKFKSGSQMQDYGTTLTSTIITVLIWYNVAVKTNQYVLFDGVRYTIQHIEPDECRKSMILTCKVIDK